MQKVLKISNDISNLSVVNHFLEEAGEELGLSADLMMKLLLVMEEAVSNVIFYAYDKEEKEGYVHIRLTYESDLLTLMISDRGKAFDPTAKEDPDITLSAEDRPIGGLGIFLIKQIMDEVSYERKEGENRLIMKKKLDQ